MAKMTIDNVTYEGTAEELRDIVRTFEVAEDVVEAEDTPEVSEFTKGERVRVTGSSIYGVNKDGEIGAFDELYYGDYSVEFDGDQLLFKTHQVAKVSEDVEPAESLTFEGAEYTLVSRKAQEGDVVVFTENDNSYFTNGEPYGPAYGQGVLRVNDNVGDELYVYNDGNGRTESNVLVYEKVAVESPLKVGDKVEVIDGSKSRYGDLPTGTIGEILDIDVDFEQMYRVDTDDDYDRFPAEALRKVANGYKRGDLVRYTSARGSVNCGRIVEVVKDTDSEGNTQVDFAPHPHGICTQNPESIELVARAKDRVDTK